MDNLNNVSVEVIVAEILSNDCSDSCYFVLDTGTFQRLAFEGKLYLLSDGLLQKRGLSVRIVVKFHGLLLLYHLTREIFVSKIYTEGFLSAHYKTADFNPYVNGLYGLRANCPHGFKAMQYVLADYSDLTHIVTFSYNGDYYLTVNHNEEYIVITEAVPPSDIVSIQPLSDFAIR